MMAQGNFRHPMGFRKSIESATTKPRTERAGGLAFRHNPLDCGIGVTLNDIKGHILSRHVVGQDVLWKTGLLLIEIHCNQFKGYGC